MEGFNYVTTIQFAYGSLVRLKGEVELASIKRPLLITDKGLRQLGGEEELGTYLQAKFAAVYDDTPDNPTEAAVRSAQRCFKKIEADGIIDIGESDRTTICPPCGSSNYRCDTGPGVANQAFTIGGGV